MIVAVNGGEKGEVLSEIRRKYNLSFALVPDPGRIIARQFGIECWPTTVWINAEGKVEDAQFGTIRDDERRGGQGAVGKSAPGGEPKMIEWYAAAAAGRRVRAGPAVPLRGVQLHTAFGRRSL